MRQKILLAVLILLVIYILYQLVDLLGIGRSSPPSIPSKAPVNRMQSAKPGTPTTAPGAKATTGQSTPAVQLTQTAVSADVQFSQVQRVKEQQYVDKVNELQMLQIQQQIAEANQAIAASKLATVTAEKNISDLLTKPEAPVSQAAYAAQLGGAPGTASSSQMVPVPPVVAKEDLTVISISMQLGKWSAVIGHQGKLYTVSVGDVLSIDGSRVVRINREGVVLKKEGTTRKLRFVSSI